MWNLLCLAGSRKLPDLGTLACLGDFTLALNGTCADLWVIQVLHWQTSFVATPATDVPHSHSDY